MCVKETVLPMFYFLCVLVLFLYLIQQENHGGYFSFISKENVWIQHNIMIFNIHYWYSLFHEENMFLPRK